MTCRGICIRYKSEKIFAQGRYDSGQKRCTSCEIFIKWDGMKCPCCGRQLKTTPNAGRYKSYVKEDSRH